MKKQATIDAVKLNKRIDDNDTELTSTILEGFYDNGLLAVSSALKKIDEGWFINYDTTNDIDIQSGISKYPLPTGTVEIKAMEAALDGSNFKKVTIKYVRELKQSFKEELDNRGSESSPVIVVVGTDFYIIPKPTKNVTDGIKGVYIIVPSVITTSSTPAIPDILQEDIILFMEWRVDKVQSTKSEAVASYNIYTAQLKQHLSEVKPKVDDSSSHQMFHDLPDLVNLSRGKGSRGRLQF
ncbi:hypothetical protein MYX07_00410 [Patescibacteria group bacterium AH-259-L07]|nr:hypothetical protein [Patescibacteria group bacterium AH-259-L07]